MSKITENLVSSCLIEPKTGLSIFSTTFNVDTTEYDSNLEELGIFGDFQSAVISIFEKLGFPLLVSRINVFNFFGIEEKVPIPQSIVFTYHPEEPHVLFFVISNKVISIDKVLEITEQFHHSTKDSIKYFNSLTEKGLIKDELRNFLQDKVKLEHFPGYLDYKLFNLPSTFIDKTFNLNITPLKLTFQRKKVKKSDINNQEIGQEFKFENYSAKDSTGIPEIPTVFEEFIQGLVEITKEGIIKFGNYAQRDYSLLFFDLDNVVFEIDRNKKSYLIYQRTFDPYGVNPEEKYMNSFSSLSFASEEIPSHPFTATNFKNRLNKFLQKISKMNIKESEIMVPEIITKDLNFMRKIDE